MEKSLLKVPAQCVHLLYIKKGQQHVWDSKNGTQNRDAHALVYSPSMMKPPLEYCVQF